jgi:hypothetical protein
VKAASRAIEARLGFRAVQPIRDYLGVLDLSADLKLLAYENESDDVASFAERFGEALKAGQSASS